MGECEVNVEICGQLNGDTRARGFNCMALTLPEILSYSINSYFEQACRFGTTYLRYFRDKKCKYEIKSIKVFTRSVKMLFFTTWINMSEISLWNLLEKNDIMLLLNLYLNVSMLNDVNVNFNKIFLIKTIFHTYEKFSG